MGRGAPRRRGIGLQPMWGPLTRLGLVVAAISAAIDQASKLWLLYAFDLPARAPVRLTPFLDLVMTWNKGISYGLFQQEGPFGQWVLLAIKVAAVALLMMWLARAGSWLTAVSLGLIIGGGCIVRANGHVSHFGGRRSSGDTGEQLCHEATPCLHDAVLAADLHHDFSVLVCQ